MSTSSSSTGTVEDLELRLGFSPLYKGQISAANCISGCPELILIEDNDDDVLMYPPASSGETIRFYSYSSSWAPAIREDDLELRLGVGAYDGCHGNSNAWNNPLEGRCKDPNAGKSGKASSRQCMSDFVEVKLKCSICMGTMEEETSTTCGHVFCRSCITGAIQVEKRCPTCFEKLSQSDIHRIYLPRATS